jgi:hypothetical protein
MENKDFTLYPEALELKQLGFDEPCLASYYHAGRRLDICEYINHGEYTVLAPTYSQAFRWFREKHNLFGQVNIHTYFIYNISNGDFKMVKEYDKLFETYEEAELACLKKLIEIVKENQK